MRVIALHNLLESNNYADSGSIVFKYAQEAVLDNEIIVIDMDFVDSVPTVFMNTSFGALMDIHGVEKTKKLFKFRNILKSQVDRITKYFNDYKLLLEAHGECV